MGATLLFTKRLLSYAVIGFVISVAGIVTGTYLSNKFILAGPAIASSESLFSSKFRIGEQFPCVNVVCSNGSTEQVCWSRGEKVKVIVFLSDHCGACGEVLSTLLADSLIVANEAELYLLFKGPQVSATDRPKTAYAVSDEELTRLDVRLYPTLVVTSSSGSIAAVTGNIRPEALQRLLIVD